MVVYNNILAGASGATSGAAAGYQIDRSLRFNSDDSSYLNRTPSTAGNQKTFTFSCWAKISKLDAEKNIFVGSSNWFRFESSNEIYYWHSGSTQVHTDAKFRDPSAWYHLVLAVDTTQSTASDRVKIYVNGVQQDLSGTYPAQDATLGFNGAYAHYLGSQGTSGSNAFNGYLAEIHNVDGQALAPTDFGEYDDNNVWQPIEYSGTYPDTLSTEMTSISSGNIFPANGTSTLNALDGSTSTALDCRRGDHADTTSIRFTPSTAITGVTKIRVWAPFANKYQINGGGYQTFTGTSGWSEIYNSSSISLTTLDVIRDSGNSGSDYGHQLHAIEINDVILTRDGSNNSFHLDFSDNSSNAALGTDSSSNSNTWTVNNLTAAGSNQSQTWSDNITGGSGAYGAAANAFDGSLSTFASPEYNSPMTYTNPSASDTVISTFEIYGRQYSSSVTLELNDTSISSQITTTVQWHTITGFSGDNFEKLYWRPTSSNSEIRIHAIRVNGQILVDDDIADPEGKNIDSLIDTPTNYEADSGSNNGGNYATLNPLVGGSPSNGNLHQPNSTPVNYATIGFSSGKYYYEVEVVTQTSGGVKIGAAQEGATGELGGNSYTWAILAQSNSDNGKAINGGSLTSSYTTYAQGDIVNCAVDMDNGKIYWGKNGTWLNSADPANDTGAIYANLSGTVFPAATANQGGALTWNFGQRPFSISSVPTGFLSLCTTNLPDPTIADGSDYFEAKLWTGNGSSQNIATNFSPDFAWIKKRGGSGIARGHCLQDIVRGAGKTLESHTTAAEYSDVNAVTAFNSDGLSIGSEDRVNENNGTYVGWIWDAGSSTVSNTDGSITSSVRANQSAGFSIVTYDDGATNGTVGHGLNAAPDFIICKSRDVVVVWVTYHSALGKDKYIPLNDTNAAATVSNLWGTAEPTSSVFGVGTQNSDGNNDGQLVAYCFTAVEGYSAFGSYEGTGNSDGPFVFCGFKPRWIMYKNADATEGWGITDTARSVDNPADEKLEPNTSSAEATVTNRIDVLSNGFKIRAGSGQSPNESGNTYIYAAFSDKAFSLNGGLAR